MKKINISCYNTLIFFLSRGCYLGICAKNLYLTSYQNGYISVILSLITGIIPLFVYYYIMKKYPDKNIFEIININLGKYLGNFINLIISIFTFFYATCIFYNLNHFISTEYLYRTPNIAIGIMIFICIIYLLFKGIRNISKTSLILFYIFSVLFILTSLGLIGLSNFSNLLPLNEYGLKNIIKGSYNVLSLNISPLFILTFIPYNKIEHNDKFIKNIITFYTLAIISILINNLFSISIYGAKFASLIEYPEFHLLKRLSLIGFLERIESILSILLIFEMIISITLSLSFVLEYINTTYKLNNNLVKIITTSLLTLFALYIFKTPADALNVYFNYFPNLTIIFYLLIPLMISIIIKIKNYTSS